MKRRAPRRKAVVSRPIPTRLQYPATEAATLMAISLRTLWRITASGSLPTVRLGARCYWRHSDIEGFLSAHLARGGGKAAPPGLLAKNQRRPA